MIELNPFYLLKSLLLYKNYLATSKHFWPHLAVLHISRGRLKERANFLNFFENKQNGEKSRMLLDASSILLQNLTPTHVNFLRTLTKCWMKRKEKLSADLIWTLSSELSRCYFPFMIRFFMRFLVFCQQSSWAVRTQITTILFWPLSIQDCGSCQWGSQAVIRQSLPSKLLYRCWSSLIGKPLKQKAFSVLEIE